MFIVYLLFMHINIMYMGLCMQPLEHNWNCKQLIFSTLFQFASTPPYFFFSSVLNVTIWRLKSSFCIFFTTSCLQAVIEGCGRFFLPHVTQDLLDLVFQSLTHTNRFVRETGYHVCASLVNCSTMEGGNLFSIYLLFLFSTKGNLVKH